MRLVSLNVGLYEKNNRKLTSYLRKHKPDIACLQEVTRAVHTNAKPEYLSKKAIEIGLKDLPFGFYAPNWQTESHETSNYHDSDQYRVHWGGVIEFGNYVKSKFPIQFAQNVYVENHFSYVTDWTNWPEQDYRAVQVIDIRIQKKPLRVLNYHGIWTRNKRGNQKTLSACRTIKNLEDEATGAVVITGDFNLFPDTESITQISGSYESLVDTYNVRTTRLLSNELHTLDRNVVDYIFVNSFVDVNNFTVPDVDVSDHLPLLLDFDIK